VKGGIPIKCREEIKLKKRGGMKKRGRKGAGRNEKKKKNKTAEEKKKDAEEGPREIESRVLGTENRASKGSTWVGSVGKKPGPATEYGPGGEGRNRRRIGKVRTLKCVQKKGLRNTKNKMKPVSGGVVGS